MLHIVHKSNVNLSPLALSCSKIPLVQGGVYYLPCGGWALGFLLAYLVGSRQVERNFIAGIELPTTPLGNGHLSTIT